jgi:sugar/nucleoside kinase (ribokinase family)
MIRTISIGFNTMDAYDFVKTMYPGGNQLNTAIYAKWAGADAAYLGYFSDDVRGKHLKWVLEKNGVDLTCCTASAATP